MRKHLLFALASVTFVACTTDLSEPTKAEVAQAIADGDAVAGDVCTSNGWNEDAVCDSWCPDGDVVDCNGGDVVCAAFIEEPNGSCDRPEDDPCIHQDPDCMTACPAIAELPDGVCEDPNQVCPTDPDCDVVACAQYIEEPNGVCERPADDPCIFQDPDCETACPMIAELPDGVCEDPNQVCPEDPDCPQN